MTTKSGRRIALAAAALTLPAVLAVPANPASAARATFSGLRTVQPLPQVPRGAVPLGALHGADRLSMRIVLRPRDPSALATFVTAASSPSSPGFRHYLAPGAFARRFGPTDLTIASVRAELERDGLAVNAVSPSHLVVSVSGTSAQFSHALHAGVVRWRLSSGTVGYRLTRAARLPAAIAGDVEGVVGVSSLVQERSFAEHVAPGAHVEVSSVHPSLSPQTCSAAQQAIDEFGGTFSPSQEGQAYGLTNAWAHGDDGTGHTVAVEEFAPYSLNDVLAYDKCFQLIGAGATTDPDLRNELVDGGTSKGSAAAADEPTLDVEEIRALAPGAHVVAYLGPNDVTGPIDTLQQIATDDSAQSVSISWGICEAFSDHAAETPIFQQMAAQGQTVFAASGDSGSSDCFGLSSTTGPSLLAAAVDDPSSQPLVTGVGGLTVNQLAPVQESVWDDCVTFDQPGCLGGAGGGGISTAFARPSWQVAPGTPTGSQRGAHQRLVPDLSVMGDPSTGMLIYFQGDYEAIGGTSMGAPLMAALDVVAAQSCGVGSLGFLNPLLYAMGRHGGDFDDVTSGNNAIALSTLAASEYFATAGYDMASGLGSPAPATFLPALCDGPATATASPATPSVSSSWALSFHTGSSAYPIGATVTIAAPPGTTLPSDPSSWLVHTSLGSHAPTAVQVLHGPSSSTDNVATLTLADGASPIDAVGIAALGVTNPGAVGATRVTVTNSVDRLSSVAPLALSAPTPSPVTSTVEVTGGSTGVSDAGVHVTATVKDAAGDLVLGARVTATATGHGRAIVLQTRTSNVGTATFTVRDDRVEGTTVSVTADGVHVGSTSVTFGDPWGSEPLTPSRAVTGVLGTPVAVPTGHNVGVGLERVAGGRLEVVAIKGVKITATTVLSARTFPPAATSPSMVRLGGWVYAAYRATDGDLIVVRQGGLHRLVNWHAEDLTADHAAPLVAGDPQLVLAGKGADVRLSIASTTIHRHVIRATALGRFPTRFTTLDLTEAAKLGPNAIGDVAEIPNGAQDGFVYRTVGGDVEMIAMGASSWLGDDLASSAELLVSGGGAVNGSPAAVSYRGVVTVAVATRDHRVDEFVGTFDNWSGETITDGAAGSSPPTGHATLPAVSGRPVLIVQGSTTEVLATTTGGRLVELSSLGVADPWSSFDLTSLARLPHGAVEGLTRVPGNTTLLLCNVAGRLVIAFGGGG